MGIEMKKLKEKGKKQHGSEMPRDDRVLGSYIWIRINAKIWNIGAVADEDIQETRTTPASQTPSSTNRDTFG